MGWYQVIKTIHGRRYLYWQKTYRVGRSVKTLNKYIGPANNPPRMGSLAATMENLPTAHRKLRTKYDSGKFTKIDYLEALAAKPKPSVTPQADVSATAPRTPEDAIWKLNPYHNPDGVDLRQYKKMKDQERCEDERIQYGPVKARLKRQLAKIRAAKRNTRGIKSVNPFIAQAIERKPHSAPKPASAPEQPNNTTAILHEIDALSWTKPNEHSTEVASQLLDEFQPHLSDWDAEFCRSLIRWKDRKGFSPKQIENLKEVARNAVNRTLTKE